MIDFVSPKKNFFSSDHKDYFDKLFHSIILFNIFPVVSGTIRLENALVKEQYDKICDEISKLDKTERKKYKKEKENIFGNNTCFSKSSNVSKYCVLVDTSLTPVR